MYHILKSIVIMAKENEFEILTNLYVFSPPPPLKYLKTDFGMPSVVSMFICLFVCVCLASA